MAEQGEKAGLERRKVLGTIAAAGAATWTAPAVFRIPAVAAGTPVVIICPVGVQPTTGSKPNTLTYQWDRTLWEWTTCQPSGQTSVQADGRDTTTAPSCSGRLSIKAFGSPQSPAIPHVTVGHLEQFTLTNLQGGNNAGQPNNNLTVYFACYDPATESPPLENVTTEAQAAAVAGVRKVTVHISCSQALCQNDIHGWFILKAAGSVNNP